MKFYEVTIILDNEQQERLENLAERYEKINGWGEYEILQFVVNGYTSNIEEMLSFMERKALMLEWGREGA